MDIASFFLFGLSKKKVPVIIEKKKIRAELSKKITNSAFPQTFYGVFKGGLYPSVV